MAKAAKQRIKETSNEKPLKIDGDFLEVFKVIKKHKATTTKKPKQ